MKLFSMVVGPIETNCYVIADGDGNAAVIDPGANGGGIAGRLQEKKLTPKAILLTHGHFDHTGGIRAFKRYYPDVPVIVGANDAPMLADAASSASVRMYGDPEDYKDLSADRTVKEGDEITVGAMTFSVIDTPGHTFGGVCYRCGDLLFSGDTLFLEEVGRTDLAGGNYDTLLESLKKLASLPDEVEVFPGHGSPTNMGHEKKRNMYIRKALSE